MTVALSDHIDDLIARLHAIDGRILSLAEGLTAEQLLWRPEPSAWGVADCIEHLITTNAAYLPRLERGITEAPAAVSARFTPSMFGRMFIKAVGPGTRRKLKTQKVFTPPTASADAATRFLAQQADVQNRFGSAAGRDLNRIKIASPATRFLKFSVAEAMTIIVAHEERHVAQAERVRRDPHFPGARIE